MITIAWAGRLQKIGATAGEIAAIQASYDKIDPKLQGAIDALIGAIDEAGLAQMFANWRGSRARNLHRSALGDLGQGVVASFVESSVATRPPR